MKKNLLAFSMLFITTIVDAQVQFGVHLNGISSSSKLVLSNPNPVTNNLYQYSSNRYSWKVGVAAVVPPIYDCNFSFMPEVNLVNKGFRDADFDIRKGLNCELMYLEVPLNLVYNVPAGDGNFLFGFGPSISYGLSGKEKAPQKDYAPFERGPSSLLPTYENIQFDGRGAEGHYKRFELGGNILTGYKLYEGIFLKANYNFGFSNIKATRDYKLRNNYFSVGIGYFFKKCK